MMQQKFQNVSHYHSAKLLQKCTSMPAFSESTTSSSNSIESVDESYRKLSIKWILSYHKKVAKDTQYLAITLLNRLTPQALAINQQNHELVALTMLLIASKMNEIYPPKITHLVAKCRRVVSKQEIIELESMILGAFGFDVVIQDTVYTHIYRILGCFYGDKLEQCEKLYRMVAYTRELYQYGDQIAAYAIIYLIIPDFVRKMKLRDNTKIKTLAIKIYNLYNETKEKYQREKENRNRNQVV